jgi:alpha-D-xyloside xylohydrolase
MLVRDGTPIAHIGLAQSTSDMDWTRLELAVFAADAQEARGLICLPQDQRLRELSLVRWNGKFVFVNDPLDGKEIWDIREVPSHDFNRWAQSLRSGDIL